MYPNSNVSVLLLVSCFIACVARIVETELTLFGELMSITYQQLAINLCLNCHYQISYCCRRCHNQFTGHNLICTKRNRDMLFWSQSHRKSDTSFARHCDINE